MAGKLIDPVVKIPPQIEQGDTITWIDEPFVDEQGQNYDATGYSLVYTIVGPFVNGINQGSPSSVTAAVQGTGWETTLANTLTQGWSPGLYQWQAKLTASGFALTVAKGELTVVPDLSQVASGFSGLSQAEQALANWQAAYAALAGTNGQTPAKSYRIGMREMTYRDVREIESAIAYWNALVIRERTAASLAQNQGNPRKAYVRFPSKFGSLA